MTVGLKRRGILMEDEDVFQAVRAINKLMHEAKVKTDIANQSLKEAEVLLKELLDATRKKTTQSSLDDFGLDKTLVADRSENSSVAKSLLAKDNNLWNKNIRLRRDY